VETSTRIQTSTARCPACADEVRLVGRLMIGEVFGCGQCAAQLEVASLQPLVLEPFARVESEEEDYV
jgi:lysine biosynthesis protein LysW